MITLKMETTKEQQKELERIKIWGRDWNRKQRNENKKTKGGLD